MEIIKQFLWSFVSTAGFSILYSCPKDTIVYSGLAGSTGWTAFYITSRLFNSIVTGTFMGALTVGILGQVLSKLNKKPATLFITPGIIPLVPGAGMYYTMFSLIEKDFYTAANKGLETFFIAAAISIGIIISSIFSISIKRVRQKG